MPVRLDPGHRPATSDSGTEIASTGAASKRFPNSLNEPCAPADEVSRPSIPENFIPFEEGRESEIWTQTLTLLSDMSKSNAKNVRRTAISGPNTLVLTFPASYHLSKQYFERSPEQLGKIERALERVVGRPIRVSLIVDESVPQSLAPSAAASDFEAEAERKVVDAGRDPLVQRALSVFEATVIRVESGTSPR